MTTSDDIIIRGYKEKVRYYGLPAMPAWLITVGPFVIGLAVGWWLL